MELMEDYKRYTARHLEGHRVRFVCDCIVRLDIEGIVEGYDIQDSEIIYIVQTDHKKVRIGENTPNLQIDIIK